MNFDPIAHIYNDFPTKFGLPRQSGMSEHLISRIVMEKDYRNIEAFRGIEEFEYLWLIWVFESMGKRPWSPTVRPPKLGVWACSRHARRTDRIRLVSRR